MQKALEKKRKKRKGERLIKESIHIVTEVKFSDRPVAPHRHTASVRALGSLTLVPLLSMQVVNPGGISSGSTASPFNTELLLFFLKYLRYFSFNLSV